MIDAHHHRVQNSIPGHWDSFFPFSRANRSQSTAVTLLTYHLSLLLSLSLNIRERGVNSGQSTIPSLCRITDTKYDIRSLFFPLPIYSPIPCMLKSKQDLSLRPIYPEFQNNIELNDRRRNWEDRSDRILTLDTRPKIAQSWKNLLIF